MLHFLSGNLLPGLISTLLFFKKVSIYLLYARSSHRIFFLNNRTSCRFVLVRATASCTFFFDDPQNPKVTFFMVMFTCRNVWIEGHSFRLLTLMLVGMRVTFMDFCHRTILLSVISLLNEPNTYSPANVDASVMYRRWRDSRGKDKEYENIIRKQVSLLFA
jgi:hypothetical protein